MNTPGNHRPARTGHGAFTLVELLVVIAIITILAGLLLPALMHAQYVAKKTVCMNNLRQVGTGLVTYASDAEGYYPADRCTKSGCYWHKDGGAANFNGYQARYKTWLVMEKTSGYCWDLEPIMQPYYGGGEEAMDGVFTCPLRKDSGNVWSTNCTQSPYALWFNFGMTSRLVSSMKRAGDKWETTNHNDWLSNSKNKSCRVLASDIAAKDWTSLIMNHPPMGGDADWKWQSNQATAGWLSGSAAADGHFLTDDLSVSSERSLHWLNDTTGGNHVNGYIPAEYFR